MAPPVICLRVALLVLCGQRDEPGARGRAAPVTRPLAEAVATVVATTGSVQFRNAADQRWQTVVVDAILPPDAVTRVGPRSSLTLRTPSGGTVVIDRVGEVTVRAALEGPKTLPFGRGLYDVEAMGVGQGLVIETPPSILAVHGQWTSVHDRSPRHGSTRPATTTTTAPAATPGVSRP